MTVRETIRRETSNLTVSERKVANAVLADYPFGGLQTIQELAERCGVSAPSITRFVSKIGFGGYQDFQRQLIGELREGSRSPLDLKATEKLGKGDEFLADYARRVSACVKEMAGSITPDQFDRIVRLVADPARNVFVLGGRISDSVAAFLSMHLRQIRSKVHHMPPNPEHWPDDVLRMRKQDVFILFDFRRYQADLVRLAEIVATKRQSSIVLITDKWMSPAARHADAVVALPTESETAWDTVVCVLAFIEALIVKVAEADWPATRKRIEAWDELRPVPAGRRDDDDA